MICVEETQFKDDYSDNSKKVFSDIIGAINYKDFQRFGFKSKDNFLNL